VQTVLQLLLLLLGLLLNLLLLLLKLLLEMLLQVGSCKWWVMRHTIKLLSNVAQPVGQGDIVWGGGGVRPFMPTQVHNQLDQVSVHTNSTLRLF